MENLKSVPVVFAVPDSDNLAESVFNYLMSIVSDERKRKTEKYRMREDACRSLVSEILVRYTLEKAGLKNETVTIKTNGYGKPSTGIEGVHFNVSHSGSWVICVADKEEVGVDVEKLHSIDKGIPERYFTSIENKMLFRCCSEDDWLNLFFKIWVLKESYIKAIGMGLSCALDSFTVIPKIDNSVEFIKNDPKILHRYLKLYDVASDYKCAVCCSHPDLPLKVNIIDIDNII